MAITTTTINAPPSGTNPILVANNVTVSGSTGDAQAIILVDPDSASQRVASISANGLKVDASGATVPVTVGNFPSSYGPATNATGTGQFVPATDSTVAIDCAANSTQVLVSGVSGKRIYVTSFTIIASAPATGAGTVQFMDSTTSTALSGAMAVTPETGVSCGSGYGAVIAVASGDTLEIVTASGAAVQGFLSYTQV